MNYDAIIWDCDGVLIDSEGLACSAAVDILEGLGYTISLEDFLVRFMGKNSALMFAEIERETGLKLAATFPDDALWARQKEIFGKSLQATRGIHEVLDTLDLPMAVASGSGTERLRLTLGMTNLSGYFAGHIYSAALVQNGKPAPDIFLYAAEQLNVRPKNCLVIEDGIHGINAAKAAGMDVYAYVGGSHFTPKMRQTVAALQTQAVFHYMQDLLPLLHPRLQKTAG